MFKIYNSSAITRKQRFSNAIVVGLATAALCTLAFVLLFRLFSVYFGILFVAMGFAIGWMIQRYGKGVQIQFSILAVVLTLLAIFVSDMFIFGGNLPAILAFLASSGTGSLWQIGYRIFACIMAFQNARIIN
ncbi:MAG: hypothetical protein IJ115_03760 [Erysipelotrichaceae bacterium]|nr:hypothetical protein [Erysipelotrichaceae bacterium]